MAESVRQMLVGFVTLALGAVFLRHFLPWVGRLGSNDYIGEDFEEGLRGFARLAALAVLLLSIWNTGALVLGRL